MVPDIENIWYQLLVYMAINFSLPFERHVLRCKALWLFFLALTLSEPFYMENPSTRHRFSRVRYVVLGVFQSEVCSISSVLELGM